MSHNSRYTITAEDGRPSLDEILESFYYGNGTARSAKEGRTPWCDWKEDMRALSTRNPGILFTVHRKGEDSGDIEVGYFLNGCYQGGMAELRVPAIDHEAWDD